MTAFNPEFYVTVRPSPTLIVICVSLHLAAVAALWANSLFSVPLQVFVTLAVVLSLLHWLKGQKTVEVPLDTGQMQQVYLGDFFIVLNFRHAPPLVLARDAMSTDEFRRSRVVLAAV